MPSEVILPRVDMDMATGKISKWFVESGSKVSKGQPLFEIETDKAAMEIESPSSGTIRDLAAASGDDIPVGSVVAWIDAEGEGPPAGGQGAPAPNAPVERLKPVPGGAPVGVPPPAATPGPGGVEKARATPLARRLARLNGIDLAALKGSGPRGRVAAGDVVAGNAGVGPRDGAAPSARAPSDPTRSPVPAAPPLALEARDLDGLAAPVRPAALPPGLPRVVRLREGSGTPVVFVHGFGGDAGAWRAFVAGQRLGRPLYAVDLPGHGCSPLGPTAGFDDLVEAVGGALAAADLGDLDLVGHSLGGGVAGALAARGALDVRSLLLVSPAGLGPGIDGGFLRGFLGAASAPSLAPWLRELVADARLITPAFVASTLQARGVAGILDDQRRIAQALFADDTQSFSIRDDVARLSIPTRIVFGAADRIIPASHLKGLPGIVATHLFPGVGHMPQMEVRDALASILMQTIAR